MPVNCIPSLARGCGLESKERKGGLFKKLVSFQFIQRYSFDDFFTFLRVITYIPLLFSREKEYVPPETQRDCRRPCLWQRRRRFPESPKHPIDCSPRVSQNRAGTPVTSRTPPVPPSLFPLSIPHSSSLSLSPSFSLSLLSSVSLSISVSPFLRSTLPSQSSCAPLCLLSPSLSLSLFSPSTFTGSIRNGEHAAVQRLREPHATTPAPNHHPSFPRLCHAWCQPVWPPTHTTFSSFPPLTSLPFLPPFSLSLFFFRPYPPPLFPAMLLPSRFFSSSSSSSSLFSSFHRSPPWPPCLFTPFFLLHPASPFSTVPSRSAVLSLPFRLAHIRASLTCMPVSYMSSASFHPPPRTTTTTYLFHALPSSSFLRPSCISLLSFHPLHSCTPLPLASTPPPTSPHPLCLRPSAPGSINIPENESRLQRRFVRERRMYDATHSPVRVQGKLRRSRICTGTVHQRRPPSRTRPATETENMGAIVLRPSSLSFSFFPFLFSFSFVSLRFFPGTENVASRLPRDHIPPLPLPVSGMLRLKFFVAILSFRCDFLRHCDLVTFFLFFLSKF